ncbi:MAG TPA: hypothetical protein VL979_03275 [Solirubrobacteraceae bacterium]|nr:hypothetical protein [Solirubrobacteraceae bacterium]
MRSRGAGRALLTGRAGGLVFAAREVAGADLDDAVDVAERERERLDGGLAAELERDGDRAGAGDGPVLELAGGDAAY